MKTMTKKLRSLLERTFPGLSRERGSALLVTLMVLVGLSLLGLTFVAFTETESAIATNERNAAQTLSIAEAGGKAVVEWFQDPTWATVQGLMPDNSNYNCATSPCMKIFRQLSLQATPTNYTVYQGYYKSNAADVLFDKSYRDNNGMFFGTENNPDLLINDFTNPLFLATFNIKLFNNTIPATMPSSASSTTPCPSCDNTQGGRVTEVRVYAPPIDAGFTNSAPGWTTASGIPGPNPNNDSFTSQGARFGIATIKVTAVKYDSPQCGPYKSGCTALSTRSVKYVIAEWPIPGPGGPVQSATNLTNAGNVHIHWGRSTSEGNLDLTKSYNAIPWHDAYNLANIERGYDNVVWPINGSNYKQSRPWLYELIDRSWVDPWWGARARGYVAQLCCNNAPFQNPQPHTWDTNTIIEDPSSPTSNPGQSNLFQGQTASDGQYHNEVLFPHIDYNFWKQVAQASGDQGNVKYLKWVSADTFTDNSGCTQTFLQWVDTSGNVTPSAGCAPSKPGFYFFDTMDGINPQLSAAPTNLTPGIQINGSTFQMAGFVYLNASDYKTTGAKGVDGWYNMPGEPYRDVGVRTAGIDPTRTDYKTWSRDTPTETNPCVPDTGQYCATLYGAGNGQWDFEDLPWSNSGTAIDGKFNVFVTLNSSTITRYSTPTTFAVNTHYFVVPWTPGCNPGDNGVAGVNCSEPHEPYLNVIYPTVAPDDNVTGCPDPSCSTMRWEDPTNQTRRAKVLSGSSPVSCTQTSANTDCTSNAYDKDGALVPLAGTQMAPLLNGVLYIEGTETSSGNATYFGSVLIRQAFSNTGTPDVWFDEKLIKGEWPPSTFKFPRVYVSTVETSQ